MTVVRLTVTRVQHAYIDVEVTGRTSLSVGGEVAHALHFHRVEELVDGRWKTQRVSVTPDARLLDDGWGADMHIDINEEHAHRRGLMKARRTR